LEYIGACRLTWKGRVRGREEVEGGRKGRGYKEGGLLHGLGRIDALGGLSPSFKGGWKDPY